VWKQFLAEVESEGSLTEAVDRMDEGLIDPYTAAEKVLKSPSLRLSLPGLFQQ
jgi:hypothetical protein